MNKALSSKYIHTVTLYKIKGLYGFSICIDNMRIKAYPWVIQCDYKDMPVDIYDTIYSVNGIHCLDLKPDTIVEIINKSTQMTLVIGNNIPPVTLKAENPPSYMQ